MPLRMGCFLKGLWNFGWRTSLFFRDSDASTSAKDLFSMPSPLPYWMLLFAAQFRRVLNSLPASPCENTVQESIPEIFSAFPGVEISLCLSPLLHINKKARLLRMRNPLTYSHPLRSGLSRRIICKYCRTSQRLGWIGHLYYKEDCSPCRTQTGTEKVASPCVRPLVWWRLVFSGVLERLQAIRKRWFSVFPA